MNDFQALRDIYKIFLQKTKENIGDFYIESLALYQKIQDENIKQIAAFYCGKIRSFANGAEIGWQLFSTPYNLTHKLSDDDCVIIITLISMLHSFCYGVERLDEVSFYSGPNSTPISFYINSIYNYIAALYLLDKGSDPIGGMVYKTLKPLGLDFLLDDIKQVLEKPISTDYSFGETIKTIRNKFLVHGTFSYNDVSRVIKMTKMRDVSKQIQLNNLIWELFNQSYILKLKLISILTKSEIKMDILKSFIKRNIDEETISQ